MRLSVHDHEREHSGNKYVYPVVSRRARGVSIGINLCTNNACNWRCVYCQVPGLVLGRPEPVDLDELRRELEALLEDVVHGDFLERHVPAAARRLNDLAFSGNGEPTAAEEFPRAVELACAAKRRFGIEEEVKLVLITNGSLVHRAHVQDGLRRMANSHGEVWYKLDSATDEGARKLNGNAAGVERARANLRLAAALCPTWIQTLVLAWNGAPPAPAEQSAYLAFLAEERRAGTPFQGVLLYGLARPSYQPEASQLAPLPTAWLEAFADRIRALSIQVQVSP
jgi:wyosine [tRNA(Phe)-imidazoG37] synthetase (radical SAM superfamily)